MPRLGPLRALGVAFASVAAALPAATAYADPPPAPTLVKPFSGKTIRARPPVTCTGAEANASIRVYIDGAHAADTAADGGGNCSTSPPDIPNGQHTIALTQSDDGGVTWSDPSAAHTIVVLSTAPTITAPSAGGLMDAADHAIRGTGAFASGFVVATVDGHDISGLAAPDGTFALNALGNLSQGAHTVTVHNVDDFSESGPASTLQVFYWLPPITLTAPSNHPINPQGAQVLIPFLGAKSGATVRLYETGNATAVATATAGAGGTGILAINPTLAEGAHFYSATQNDNLGHDSTASAPIRIDVDSVAPNAPAIQFPTDNELINNSMPTFVYGAEPLAMVAYEVDGSSYAPLAAFGDGTVELFVAVPLSEGHHTIRAKVIDAADNESPWSPLTGFDVDSIAPTDLDLLSPEALTRDNSGRWEFATDPDTTVAISVNGGSMQQVVTGGDGRAVFNLGVLADGEYEIDATTTDVAGNASSQTFHMTIDTTGPTAPVIVSPSPGDYLSTQRPQFAVTADPRQDLGLRIDGAQAGFATTDDTGQSVISLADDVVLTEGTHTAIVYADDALGNQSASSAVTFIVDPNGTLRPPPAPWVPSPLPSPLPGAPISHTPRTLRMAIRGVHLSGRVLSTCARSARRCKEKTATVSVVVNQAADVKLTLTRKVRRSTKAVGTVSVKATRAGTVSYVLHRKFARHTLAAGSYKLVVEASPKAGGAKSNTVTNTITVR